MIQTSDTDSSSGHFIQTRQGLFHYHAFHGPGPAIHFCHGNSLSAGTALPFLRRLADHGCRVTALDLRGHGRSTKEKTGRMKNWDIFIRDLESFVRAIADPPVVGMGHSIGGYFTYAAAALYPGLFSRLVLLDPIILPRHIVWLCALARVTGLAGKHRLPATARKKKSVFPSREAAFAHYSGKGMFRTWQPEFVQAYVRTAVEPGGAGSVSLCCSPEFEARIYESVPLDTWKHAGRISIPVLVLRGEHSDLFSRPAAERLAGKIRDCRLETLAGLGHFLMMEDPDRVVDTVLPFIRSA